MVYEWKSGSRFTVDAAQAASVMNDLEQNGGLTPQALVDASRPEDAPLHNEFDWNDTTAAESWRKQQARTMINCIVIRKEETQREPVRAFIRIEPAKPGTYVPVQVLLSTDDGKAALRKQAYSELCAFRSKYQAILAEIKAANELNDVISKLAE